MIQKISEKTQFNIDHKREEQFSDFLDNHFYAPLSSILTTPETPVLFTRTTDISQQLSGIDVVLHEGYHQTTIDEKCRLRTNGKDTSTFAFELSFIKDGVVDVGWFLDPRKRTQAYLLCWPRLSNTDEPWLQTEFLLVSRSRLIDTLHRHGFPREALAEYDEAIRAGNMHGRYRTHCPDVWFFHSMQYAEQPINMILTTAFLSKVAMAHLILDYDKATETSLFCGNWLGKPMQERVVGKPEQISLF